MKKSDKEKLDEFQVQIDQREQTPWTFGNRSVFKSLETGDYTVIFDGKSYEKEIVVERKRSVGELYSASGKERDRFERELERLAKIEFKWVICEFSMLDIVNSPPPSNIYSLHKPMDAVSVYGSIISWHIKFGVPFLFLDNRINGRAWAFKLFQNYVKYKILELVSP